MPTQPSPKPPSTLQQKLKAAEPDVRAYVKHLESENRKLQSKVVKFQAQHFTDKNRIAALEKELKKGHVTVILDSKPYKKAKA